MKFSEWYADNESEVRKMIDTALELRLSADQIMDLVKVNLHVAYTCGGTAALKELNKGLAGLSASSLSEPKAGDPAYYTSINGKPIGHGKDAAPSIEWLTKARVWDAELNKWRDA